MMRPDYTDKLSLSSRGARTLGAIFDEAFDLYKNHFLTIAVLVALVFIPLQIGLHAASDIWLKPIEKRLEGQTNFDDNIGEFVLFAVAFLFTGDPNEGVPGILQGMALVLVSAPVTIAVAELYAGRPISVREAYRRAAPHLGRLLGAWTLIALVMLCIGFVSMTVISFVFVLAAASLAPALPEAVLIGFLLVVLGVPYLLCSAFAALSFIFTTPLMVLEGLSFTAAAARNARLSGKKRFRHVWAAAVFLPLVVIGLRYLILLSVGSALAALRLAPLLAFLAQTTFASLIYFFFEPYWMIFITLLYYDCRYRREGYDVSLLAETLPPPSRSGLAAENGNAPPAALPAPRSQPELPPLPARSPQGITGP